MTRQRAARSKGPEAIIQDTILDYLAATRVSAFRMNTGQMVSVDANTGRRRATRFGVKGMAGILAFPKVYGQPFPLWIEVKSQVGDTSPFQDSFAADVRDDGQAYMVARDVEDVIEALGKLKRLTR